MRHGQFTWYQLMTNNMDAAEKFYATLFDWGFSNVPEMPMPYHFIETAGERIGGIMPLAADSPGDQRGPHWQASIAVDDVDETADQVMTQGGTIRLAPHDIPGGFGRLAEIADPFGAVVSIFSPVEESQAAVHRPGVSGFGGWHELYTQEVDQALAFYTVLFGWTKDVAMDMGEMGIYQLFSIDGVQSGGIMKRTPEMPTPLWNYYFNCDSVTAAVPQIKAAGGEVTMGPHEVPGGSWIVMATDPQGALFSLNSPAP